MTSSEADYILGSVTNRALSLEVRIARALRELGWNTSHSAYFRDPKEQKDREIDVAAVRRWTRRRRKHADAVQLHIFAECKTIAEGKVLFAPLPPNGEQTPYRQWLDVDEYAIRARLFEVLTAAGMQPAQAARALKRIHSSAYPKGESIFAKVIRTHAPPAEHRVSAGREVTAKKERSPLYDAMQALYATIDGTANELFVQSLDEVRDRVVVANARQRSAEAVAAGNEETTTLTLFHPVVVTDAKLWLRQDDDDPVEITSCRIEQSRIATTEVRWVDVVHESAFAEYAAEVTRWYAEKLTAAGCAEW